MNHHTEKLLASHPEWEVHTLLPINTPEEAGEYIITQDAYITGTDENPYYESYALLVGHEYITPEDVDGDEDDYRVGEYAYYRVVWEPVDGWEEEEDASNHCDWTLPSYIEYLGAI